jgi:hypothetical protein
MATTIKPVTPGYYRMDPSKLSLAEMRRWTSMSFFRLIFLWLFREGLPQENTDGPYLPAYWDDLATTQDQLSERCLDAIIPRVADLERLGFYVVSYQELKKHNFPLMLDNGGAWLLHKSGDFGATALWTFNRLPAPQTGENTVVATSIFTSCMSGRAISVGSSKMYLDPPPSRRAICMPGAHATQLWERIQEERRRLDMQGDPVLKMTTTEEAAKIHDLQSELTWHHQVHVRKVMVWASEIVV